MFLRKSKIFFSLNYRNYNQYDFYQMLENKSKIYTKN